METTTIYVRVAKPVDETQMPSPLDRLYHPPKPKGDGRPRSNVGRLRLHFQSQADPDGRRSAKVTIEVRSAHRPIYFTGTAAVEVRPGFVTLQIPSLEHWTESLSWLTPMQRSRFEEPEFYEMLQREIATRLPHLSKPPS